MSQRRRSIQTCVLLVGGAMALGSSFAVAEPAPTSRAAAPDRFHFAGEVVDFRGNPVAGVTVTATHRSRTSAGYGFIDQVTTDAAGRFEIDRAVALSGAPRAGMTDAESIWIEARDATHVFTRREDLAGLASNQLESLRLEMKDGRNQVGRVVDRAGKPVEGALVRATFGEDWSAGKGAATDADGRFTLDGLLAKDADLTVFAVGSDGTLQAHHATLPAVAPAQPITLQVEPIEVAAADVRDVLGMKLVTLDEKAADALGRHGQAGVLVLDPGERVARLAIGDVRPGDVFWYVGETEIKTADDFRAALRAEAAKADANAGVQCRVVYRFRRADFDGTNTQHVRLNAGDVASLK